MKNVIDLHEHTGFNIFTCTGCGVETIVYAPIDREPVCALCRFVAEHPDLPDEIIERLRGR